LKPGRRMAITQHRAPPQTGGAKSAAPPGRGNHQTDVKSAPTKIGEARFANQLVREPVSPGPPAARLLEIGFERFGCPLHDFREQRDRPRAVGVEQHVLHAVIGMQHDEDAFAAGCYRVHDPFDEGAVVIIEFNMRGIGLFL
jgi:hypothetical protein